MIHSIIGGSKCHRYIKCTGSIWMNSKSEDYRSKAAANQGQMAHTMGETALKNNWDEKQLRAAKFTEPYPEYIDEEMYEKVMGYVNFCRSNYVNEAFWGVETPVSLPWIHQEAFGTADNLIGVKGEYLIVTDLKYGVLPPHIDQLKFYALGAVGQHNPDGYKMVRLIFYQPRGPNGSNPVSYVDLSVDDLYHWAETELKPAIDTIFYGQPSLNGGSWCAFCNADYWCSEFKRVAFRNAVAEFGGSSGPLYPPVKTLSEIELSRFKTSIDDIKNYVKMMEDYIDHAVINEGRKLPGFKTIKSLKNTKIKDSEKFKEYFEMLYGNEIYKEPQLKNLADLKKVLTESEFAEYTHRPEGGLKIVPASHKAPEYKGAIDEFTNQ